MFSHNIYCAVCGCAFSLPDVRDPVDPDPDEDPCLKVGDPYDSRLLPREQTEWLRNFRLVGRWRDIDPLFVNESSIPDLFTSSRAEWYFGSPPHDPGIPNTEGKMSNIPVYAASAEENDRESMLLPMHEACLDIIHRLCDIRKMQEHTLGIQNPRTLPDFCDALRRRKWKNELEPDVPHSVDRYYAYYGGLEWPHNYYGARQFWSDEWDTEPGWELLCADPSPLKIPRVDAFLKATLDSFSSSAASHTISRKEIADRLGWLLPEELNALTETELGSVDWDKAIPVLLQKAHDNGPQAGDDEERREGKLRPTSAPLGLQNRWRIWKILQDV